MHPRFDGPFLAGDKVNVWRRWRRGGDFENARGLILYEKRDRIEPLRGFYFRVRVYKGGEVFETDARFSSLTMRETPCQVIDGTPWG